MACNLYSISILAALKNFDSFPDNAYVRMALVQALLACSASTVWRMVKSGQLPSPHKLSAGVTAWNVGELRQALNVFRTRKED